MVARTRTEGELVVIFQRDGERAAATAVLMIAGRGVLHAGDHLLVQRYDEG